MSRSIHTYSQMKSPLYRGLILSQSLLGAIDDYNRPILVRVFLRVNTSIRQTDKKFGPRLWLPSISTNQDSTIMVRRCNLLNKKSGALSSPIKYMLISYLTDFTNKEDSDSVFFASVLCPERSWLSMEYANSAFFALVLCVESFWLSL